MNEANLIEQAEKAAQRLEAANAAMADLVKRQEAMEARQEAQRILGGRAAAGAAQAVQMSEEEKLKADMKNAFKGTLAGEYLK